MPRKTGDYRVSNIGGEEVRAFIPLPLPPQAPPLELDASGQKLLDDAMAALGRLSVAAQMVPSHEWFLYGFLRKEAVVTSQIEGTQATLQDVLEFEATQKTDRPDDVREVCNYVDAMTYARRAMARPTGPPLGIRLLCEAHKRLMRGARGAKNFPGEVRRSQNWIGGTRPGNAVFVPPPPDEALEALSLLESWVHAEDTLPPLVRAGLAHVQFETIHPFLDGNGRLGRLLIVLLLEHWGLLESPLLYLSVAFKRHRDEYYRRLSAVRIDGDWEGWTEFFLDCIREAANDASTTSQQCFALLAKHRKAVLRTEGATVTTIQLFELLPGNPLVTLSQVIELLGTTKPTATKAIDTLCRARVLREITGKRRDRVYAYHDYLKILSADTAVVASGE